MLCPTCHTENRDNARFCKRCGASFVSEQPETDAQEQVQPPLDVDQASPEASPPPIEENQSGEKTSAEAIEDISLAPTQILTPQQMMAYHARRWQQEEPDISSQPTMVIAPPAETQTPPSEVESAAETPAAATRPEEENNTTGDVIPMPETEEQPPAQEQTAQEQAAPRAEFPVLPVGTTLIERYEVTEIISDATDEHIYHVVDHQGYQHCWNCGSEQNASGDEFCIDCGAELLNAPYIMHEYPLEASSDNEAHVLQGTIINTFVEQDHTYLIEQLQAVQIAFPNGVHLVAASDSDAGTVRRGEPNEDSTLVLELERVHESIASPAGIYVIADGMGGHANGQGASRLTISTIAERILHELLLPPLAAEGAGEQVQERDEDTLVELLRSTIEEANTALCQLNQRDQSDMGSTLTGFMAVGDHAYIFNVGDSRTYMLRDGNLYQLTTDHSLVGQLVAGGLIEPDDVYTHPQRSQIYRSIGDKPNVQIDIFKQQVHPGDILLSCSDGLWEMIRNPQIADILINAPDPQTACAQLIEAANTNGGEDNVSAVVVFVR